MKFTNEYLNTVAPDALKANGFDECIVGVGYRCGSDPVLVYDIDLVVEKIMKRDMCDYDDALDYFECEIAGKYTGDSDPLFMNRRCDT